MDTPNPWYNNENNRDSLMKIIEDVKLDFADVLILPKRSTLDSRSKVTLGREYTFKHAKIKYEGLPILASNMDTVGTFAMAEAFKKFNMGIA
jgi:GMP reductase